MEIEISKGMITLRKPLAGERNKALMKAETPEGIKGTVFLVELLPSVVVKHPFGAQPVKQALDSLEVEDYDKLIEAVGKLIQLPVSDVEKKSEQPSTQEQSQKSGG